MKLKMILVFLAFSNSICSQTFYGEAKIVISSTSTLDQAKTYVVDQARADALSKFGVYIEVDSKLSYKEFKNTITEDFKETILSLSSSIVKQKWIKIEKKLINDEFYLIASGEFIIEKTLFDKKVDNYMRNVNRYRIVRDSLALEKENSKVMRKKIETQQDQISNLEERINEKANAVQHIFKTYFTLGLNIGNSINITKKKSNNLGSGFIFNLGPISFMYYTQNYALDIEAGVTRYPTSKIEDDFVFEKDGYTFLAAGYSFKVIWSSQEMEGTNQGKDPEIFKMPKYLLYITPYVGKYSIEKRWGNEYNYFATKDDGRIIYGFNLAVKINFINITFGYNEKMLFYGIGVQM
jgi:hypothetical protein